MWFYSAEKSVAAGCANCHLSSCMRGVCVIAHRHAPQNVSQQQLSALLVVHRSKRVRLREVCLSVSCAACRWSQRGRLSLRRGSASNFAKRHAGSVASLVLPVILSAHLIRFGQHVLQTARLADSTSCVSTLVPCFTCCWGRVSVPALCACMAFAEVEHAQTSIVAMPAAAGTCAWLCQRMPDS